MTMYPDGGQPMYMLTWPDVGTFNTGLALIDNITLTPHHHIRLSAKGAWQRQYINSDEGFHALSIYFPDMNQGNSRLIGRPDARLSPMTIGAAGQSAFPLEKPLRPLLFHLFRLEPHPPERAEHIRKRYISNPHGILNYFFVVAPVSASTFRDDASLTSDAS